MPLAAFLQVPLQMAAAPEPHCQIQLLLPLQAAFSYNWGHSRTISWSLHLGVRVCDLHNIVKGFFFFICYILCEICDKFPPSPSTRSLKNRTLECFVAN